MYLSVNLLIRLSCGGVSRRAIAEVKKATYIFNGDLDSLFSNVLESLITVLHLLLG